MKIVLSYALFRHAQSCYEGKNGELRKDTFFPRYLDTMIAAGRSVWPEAEIRIHHDDHILKHPIYEKLQGLASSGKIRLFMMGHAETLCGSMLWRMAPIFDHEVGWVVCRDMDALTTPREKAMFEEAVRLGAWVHSIHDASSHDGIMGGTSAFYAPEVRRTLKINTLPALLEMAKWSVKDLNVHGSDQEFLNKAVYPSLVSKTVFHTSNGPVRLPVHAKSHPADHLTPGVGIMYVIRDAEAFYGPFGNH